MQELAKILMSIMLFHQTARYCDPNVQRRLSSISKCVLYKVLLLHFRLNIEVYEGG